MWRSVQCATLMGTPFSKLTLEYPLATSIRSGENIWPTAMLTIFDAQNHKRSQMYRWIEVVAYSILKKDMSISFYVHLTQVVDDCNSE
jgi:hypothetical protein